MPKPGAAEAPRFNGQNVTKFLRHWEDMAEDYKPPEDRQVRQMHLYYTREAKLIIERIAELAIREEARNRLAHMKEELRGRFRAFDEEVMRNYTADLITFLQKPLPSDPSSLSNSVFEFENLLAHNNVPKTDKQYTYQFFAILPFDYQSRIQNRLNISLDEVQDMSYDQIRQILRKNPRGRY